MRLLTPRSPEIEGAPRGDVPRQCPIGALMISTILAIAIAKFLDPIFVAINLLLMYWFKRWWLIPIAALITASLYQLLLQDSRAATFVSALIAMLLQGAIARGFWRGAFHR